MTAIELRRKSTEELKTELTDLKETLFRRKFQGLLGQLEDISQLKKLRKDIARIHTVLRARELGIEKHSR
ncbi:50S ribosomal protein L29 [Candidatus Poribacteria bacterium]|nr:50S ribosomal protein L29 [Candidatus Poribacteria bacterium]